MPSGPYRYASPVARKSATGLVAAVYEQMATDFLLGDGPLMSLSPAPEILAAAWALTRETEIVGTAPRVNKELVAVAVSRINNCDYCIDAHTALAHATGVHDLAETVRSGKTPDDPEIARLVEWAEHTGSPDAASLDSLPFSESERAEYLGVALVTHFINRMVQALLHDRLLPGRLGSSAMVRRLAGRAFARAVREGRQEGLSLVLLPGTDICTPPGWAGTSSIGAAWSGLRQAANRAGALLGSGARLRVRDAAASWDGAPLSRTDAEALLDGVGEHDRAGVRLAILAALAPRTITDDDVAAWRRSHPDDAALVRVLAFGAMTAVERIESWVSSDNTLAMTGD